MKKVRFHGRGGQGAVTASEVLAMAAFKDNKFSQAFPAFGVERRGAPVQSFTKISDQFIRERTQIYNPDYVVVMDPTLVDVVDVSDGLGKGGKIIINSNVEEDKRLAGFDSHKVDATGIALKHLGIPIVNIVMLGAFIKVSGDVTMDSLAWAINKRFGEKLGKKNIDAAKAAYDAVA